MSHLSAAFCNGLVASAVRAVITSKGPRRAVAAMAGSAISAVLQHADINDMAQASCSTSHGPKEPVFTGAGGKTAAQRKRAKRKAKRAQAVDNANASLHGTAAAAKEHDEVMHMESASVVTTPVTTAPAFSMQMGFSTKHSDVASSPSACAAVPLTVAPVRHVEVQPMAACDAPRPQRRQGISTAIGGSTKREVKPGDMVRMIGADRDLLHVQTRLMNTIS